MAAVIVLVELSRFGRLGLAGLFFGRGAGGDRFWAFGFGDAEHGLAMLALHQFASHFIRNRKNFATAKIRTDELAGHRQSPQLLSAFARRRLNVNCETRQTSSIAAMARVFGFWH